MKTTESIVGHRIVRLLQTPSRPVGVVIQEFSEAHWIDLVAELDDGTLIKISEYDWSKFEGAAEQLDSAQLIQSEYSLSDVEGRTIVTLRDAEGEFAIVLDNGRCLKCSGAPGGNYPWIYGDESDG